ncbi:CRISPR-associated helicase/endonuclease Cas3 [Thiocystis violascens]|uniref:CRISPR-associated helicase, Cas3 family n=1 Tax=Thiocystis violascens (strain ATCC 17096 / DSM 198 / 6111) TaxID=765911 RepID=I3Y7Z2_THIV6|nr:CRISPR-associated helicase/endonuclease Cas3 [Thiocystis violascens]AFL73110.1 CRISPR-associated helicase, Cas3 family [Thiocystis violascens DSM 198]
MKAFNQCDAFGKLERDQSETVIAWHSLIDHLIDVAACFVRLCRCRSIRRAMEQSAGRALTANDIARLAVLVFLHDLGKANSGFQAKRWPGGQAPTGWPDCAGHRHGHSVEALDLLRDEAFLEPLIDCLPVAEIDTWGEAVFPLFRASISHHGRPVSERPPGDWPRSIWKPVIDAHGNVVYDPASVLVEIGRQARALYPEAFTPGGISLPEASALDHLFAGLVQLADWLGSDTEFFPFSAVGEDRAWTSVDYADRAVMSLGLDAADSRRVLEALSPSFAQVFDDNSPYPIQTAMDAVDLGPLMVLESETGSGKTEAALWRFVHLFERGEVDSLYFALPTRVSASQVYERICKAVNNLWSTNRPIVVRALPGYAAADGHEPKALPDFKVQWPDDPADEEAHRRWAAESPKRFLAAPIAVGTIDQALLGALRVRHAHLRHALLARSLLVVDEVHASDPYMTVLLERLLQAHLGCGGHALLLSATLGSSARARYLAVGQGSRSAPPAFQAACDAPYPALSDRLAMRAIASTIRPKSVTWSLRDLIDDPGAIAGLAIDAASAGAKVLIVRNTVPAAIAVFQAIEKLAPDLLFEVNGARTLHHSRFSREDRPLLDAAIQAQLGKKNRPSGPRIVIGTQTLEQSLDLDADLLITDLCPMDVLLQRIGRLHRHPPAQRPLAYRSPQAWILTPTNHDLSPLLKNSRHGLGPFRDGDGIYPDLRNVEATRRLILERPSITIPADNRILVESATHTDHLAAMERLGEDWARLGERFDGRASAKRTIGYQSGLEIDKAFDKQQPFPNEKEFDIATRLGARDRLLIFDSAPIGPFGSSFTHLPIRHFLISDEVAGDTQPIILTNDNGELLFSLGPAHFRYSRLGLEKIEP